MMMPEPDVPLEVDDSSLGDVFPALNCIAVQEGQLPEMVYASILNNLPLLQTQKFLYVKDSIQGWHLCDEIIEPILMVPFYKYVLFRDAFNRLYKSLMTFLSITEQP